MNGRQSLGHSLEDAGFRQELSTEGNCRVSTVYSPSRSCGINVDRKDLYPSRAPWIAPSPLQCRTGGIRGVQLLYRAVLRNEQRQNRGNWYLKDIHYLFGLLQKSNSQILSPISATWNPCYGGGGAISPPHRQPGFHCLRGPRPAVLLVQVWRDTGRILEWGKGEKELDIGPSARMFENHWCRMMVEIPGFSKFRVVVMSPLVCHPVWLQLPIRTPSDATAGRAVPSSNYFGHLMQSGGRLR